MKVLSLFDGIAVGYLALKRAGIHVDQYFASEIDKYAIRIAEKNSPGIIHIGKVEEIDVKTLPKIDLLIGGSPCQGFSSGGKGLNFEDPRSKLFFEFVRIKNELTARNPDLIFLLENVKMKRKWENTISQYLGIYPVEINSALVSAQTRKRLYWTNIRTRKASLFDDLISDIPQPEDRGIYLKDIIENGYTEKQKSYGLQASRGDVNTDRYIRMRHKQVIWRNKAVAEKYYLSAAALKRLKFSASRNFEKDFLNKIGRLMADGKGVGNVADMDVIYIPEATKKGYIEVRDGDGVDLTFPKSKTRCGRLMRHKLNCLTTNDKYMIYKGGDFRRLTPLECERAQTLSDNYTAGVSDAQRYKATGNCWTANVLAHIFSFLDEKWKEINKIVEKI